MADTPSDPENSFSAAGTGSAGSPSILTVPTTTMPQPAAPSSPGATSSATAALFHMPTTLSSPASTNNEENASTAFTFKSAKHFSLNGEKMKKFFAVSQLCDVRLTCAETTIEAHRVVLAASSDYFAAMFTGTMNESRQNEIEIRGVDPLSLKCLINFCYTGEICLTEACVESLLSGACLLQLYEVVDACSDYLLNQLHPSNCLGIRNFAEAQGCQKLRRFADTFTTDHFIDVVQQNEYVLLPPDDLYRLLSSDDLNVSCETQVFQALLAWLNHDLTHRRQYVGRLLSAVRLAFINPDYIMEQIESNSCFSADGTCQDLIAKAYKFRVLPDRCRSLVNCRRRKSTAGALYVVGGMDANKGSLAIERFDYVKNQWLLVGQMSSRRLQFGAAVLENKIYVIGGREGLKALSSFEYWDSEMGTWTAMGNMNTPRHGLGVVVLENVIYAIGGHDGWSYLSSAERWHLNAKGWSPIAEMNTPRSGAGVAVLDSRIYVIGGRDGSQCLRSAEYYSPHTNKWTVIAAMSKKRGSVGVGVLHNLIYVLGGLESPSCNGTSALTRYCCVERYDPKTDQWCFVANLSIGRDGIAVGTLGDHLFAIGGYSGQHYMQLVEVYDEEANEWTKEGNLMNGRAGACVAVIPSYEHHVPVSNPTVFNANYM